MWVAPTVEVRLSLKVRPVTVCASSVPAVRVHCPITTVLLGTMLPAAGEAAPIAAVSWPDGTTVWPLPLAGNGPVTCSPSPKLAPVPVTLPAAFTEKVKVPVLGVVENMSIHVCSQCGHEEHIFGEGGGVRMAEQYGVDFLGALPLDGRIRADTDEGKPTVVSDPDGPVARQFKDVARRIAAKLSLQARDYTQAFPKIMIQND